MRPSPPILLFFQQQGQGPMENEDPQPPEFQRMLEEFKQGLKKRDQETFKLTTLDTLSRSIATLQARLHAERRLQNPNRLVRFLEAIKQYGEILRVFCINNEVMAFIWGPVKLLLETASSCDRAFNELLNTYERMGEEFPLLLQYRDLFQAEPQKVQILVLIYKDIIKFHEIALGQFRRPRWEDLFDITWNTCKTRLLVIISEIARRRSSIENQSGYSHIEESQDSRSTEDARPDTELEERDFRRRSVVCSWLKATNPDTDQDRFSNIRADHPGTGRWLFSNQFFNDWFHPQFVTIPPLLWLKGLPGAGKTILASLVVEEARKLTPPVTVLFFYCKRDQPEQNSFDALARSFLLQLLKQDKGLLAYLYRKCCDSHQAVLGSPPLLKELLAFAFASCERAYIVIDGLDECARDERKSITQWFRNLVDTLPHTCPDRLRCLFVSQDDSVARKDLADLVSIKILAEDNKDDILEYSLSKSNRLGEKFELSEEEASRFAIHVADAAKGMFLLARLVWANLLGQTSIAGVEAQLGKNFPDGINEAYERIMDRIAQQASPAALKDILWLLGWLVCSKRPLKWHEIQILKSINLDERSVEVERNRFRVDAKDLCESLVEIQPDGTLELVHVTAKSFLGGSERYIDKTAKELEIACQCIDYLNLPAFQCQPTNDRILKGEYGFMDYAVLHWIPHLEVGAEQPKDYNDLMNSLSETLETFIRQYWLGPTATVSVSARTKKKLQYFQDLPFYGDLEQAIGSSKKQLRHFGEMREGEIALNLLDTVCKVRKALEQLASSDLEPSVQKMIEERYGRNLFKCPRFSCQFFTTGFSSAQDRDNHIAKHTRPFRCTDEACTGFAFGFSTAAARDKHLKDTHSTAATYDLEFPTDEDVRRGIQNNTAEGQASLEPTGSSESESSESEQEAEQRRFAVPKRTKQTEFKCPHCSKVYAKKYNLESHLRSHTGDRPYECDDCGDAFARASDYNRHMKKHTGERQYVCRGVLQNGASWGCGKAFSRADTLRTHYKSEVGKICRLPFLQEQERQQEEQQQGQIQGSQGQA
ncbi:hypothetical protein MRS44_018309 [Fusarium solani]|uniref:uncharacterized protein n=1 Tax=Fusarium solani TaxID=169388 RepID=UPI0032C40B8A|nr:hypothetical protein MRS44_018309 [Fusarium solani]